MRYGALLVAAALLLPLSAPAHAQQVSGSGWAAVAGGTLGLFSGAVLGFGGSAIPCSQTRAGVRCVRAAVISGGLIGFAAGLAMGAGDEEAVKRAGCTTAIVDGQDQYAPGTFEYLREILWSRGNHIGGIGLKIHPSHYRNLYWGVMAQCVLERLDDGNRNGNVRDRVFRSAEFHSSLSRRCAGVFGRWGQRGTRHHT